MSEHIVELLVGPKGDNSRLDVFLSAQTVLPSRSACTKLIEEGRVTINATLATSKSEKVMLGDRLLVSLPETDLQTGLLRPNPDIPLDIRFEDNYLLVLSKQAGLVCHPSPGHVDDTLANALVAHCGYGHLGMLQGEERPGIVHRLDMDTSGLMIAAKTDEVQKNLQDLIRLRVLDRRYIVLVQGYVTPDEGTIETGIARSTRDRLKMMVTDMPGSREAITTFRTLERFEAGRRGDGYSLLECHLYTGRTHQIRVHMRHIGHPVVGDQLYGKKDQNVNLGLKRQFLHSWHIQFEHPITGENISLADSRPIDLREALLSQEDMSMGRTIAGKEICPQL